MNSIKQNKKTMEDIINHISKKTYLVHFLSDNNIVEVDEVFEIQRYEKNGDRSGIIVGVIEKKSNERKKILFDIRIGQPSVYQVYDALYEVGKNCDIKIITYSYGFNDYDEGIPVADEFLVSGLIAQLQNMNVPIILYGIDYNFKMEYIDMYQDWNQVNRLKPSKPPTKEQFMAETFWAVYFDSFAVAFYEPWKAFSGEFSDIQEIHYIVYIDCEMFGEIMPFWDENGVRYVVKQCDDSDEYLKKVLDVDMPALKERYGENSVEFENVVGQLPRLYIKYSDKPFSWLYTATPRQVTEFAKKMYSDVWGLRFKIEDTIEKLYKDVPA